MNNLPTRNGLKTLVIGIGNLYRGDDAVGIVVAHRLRARNPPGVMVVEANGEGATLLDTWKDAPAVIVLDAANSGAAPGTIHRFDAGSERMPSRFFHCSTHAFSLAEAIELARALGQPPSQLIVYGIEGKDFTAGHELSAEAQQAAAEVVKHVIKETRANTNSPKSAEKLGAVAKLNIDR